MSRIEFVPADSSAAIAPGEYRFVCEEGVFGNEEYETSGFAEGRHNDRIEVRFTVAGTTAIDRVRTGTGGRTVRYFDLSGAELLAPATGSITIETDGLTTRKTLR
ncbi:MAG: hypothetical protein NC336_04680 [Clostridium sp.]|nr:hypothetical protein [Clostridium sp.]